MSLPTSLADLAAYCRDMAIEQLAMSQRERDLWTQLANEIDDYLQPAGDEPDLFGA